MIEAVRSTALYVAAARRVLKQGRPSRLLAFEDRLVFVIGSPRSGTTFFAGALGTLPGFVDLTEVNPLKARIPQLVELPEEEAARELRRILERVRRLALVYGRRAIEQTPETAYVASAALAAYPEARAIHLVRDGRDVVCSLLERGWLTAKRAGGADDAGLAYGVEPRFWVEPERREEFRTASDATRAAWAWRRYVTAARAEPRALELRYEQVVGDPATAAETVAAHLGVDASQMQRAIATGHDRSVGRWQRDLGAEQLADVEREAGPLLEALGYKI